MPIETLQGILLPFLGTVLGAACVFIMRDALPPAVQKSLTGFAAGVMVAASCLLYASPSPRDVLQSRMPSSA